MSTVQDTIIIMAKHAIPGFSKTRLIPALGPQGAAQLSEQLTIHCFQVAHQYASSSPSALSTDISTSKSTSLHTNIEIHVAHPTLKTNTEPDSSDAAVEISKIQDAAVNWVNNILVEHVSKDTQNICVILQPTVADLGTRMHLAFEHAFQSAKVENKCSSKHHSRCVVMVGVDTPEVTSEIWKQAFDALKHRTFDSTTSTESIVDLVLGPALDGGYYLIGFRDKVYHQLFTGITWSTDTVLQITLRKARDLGLRVHLLPPLSDIDEEKDLQLWYEYKRKLNGNKCDCPRMHVEKLSN